MFSQELAVKLTKQSKSRIPVIEEKEKLKGSCRRDAAETLSWVSTDLFPPHGLKHFLQLDTELLDVVEDNAGL